MMNDDIKEFPVYGLCRQGLVPIEIHSTEDYNHYTHHLHHFIKQQEWKRNKEWFEERGIEQKLILMPVQVHVDLHACISNFKEKYNIDRGELLFNRRNYEQIQSYQHWNNTTLTCYHQKMKCKGCPNDWACNMNYSWCNPYKLQRQVKFATLMTYANVGKPKGE